jgi:hypothetical protein
MPQSNVPGVVRQPWVGRHYPKGILGAKLLLVGESHYKKDEGRDENRTREIIQSVLDGGRIPFYTKVADLFAQPPESFFDHVAFYNYLQEVLEGPKQPLSHAQRILKEDQELFIATLQKLRPERVLILGKTNWRYLPSKYPDDLKRILCSESRLPLSLPGRLRPSEKNAYWYQTRGGHWALVGAISHPSAPGFSTKHWHRWVRKFMEFEGEPPC